MFINVTAKAQKVFRKYPSVKDADHAKQVALANPIYSWHCSYFTAQRHRMLCFMNDASGYFVVLPNITAADYGQLKEKFEDRLTKQLRSDGLKRDQISDYLDKAGAWEINHTINRQILGYLTQEVSNIKYIVGESTRQSLTGLANLVKRVGGLDNDLATPELFRQAPDWQAPVAEQKEGKQDQLRLQNTVQQLYYFTNHREQFLNDDNFDSHMDQLQQVNQQLIDDFINANQKQLSQKTLNRHRNRLIEFLSDFLAFRMGTIFTNDACDLEEPIYHGFSFNEMKQTRTALKKLYQFLFDRGQISQDELKYYKKSLNSQLKDGVDLLDEADDFDNFDDLDDVGEFDDQEGLADFPEPTLPPTSADMDEMARVYCTAAVNLYGLISCDQLYRIMVKQNPQASLDPHRLVNWFEKPGRKHRSEFIINNLEGVPVLIHPKIYHQGIQENLMVQQLDLPFYMPSRNEFLNYQDPGYIEENASVKKLRQFVIAKLGVPRLQADGWVNKVRALNNEHFIQSPGDNLHDLNEELNAAGYGCSNKAEVEELVNDYMAVYNQSRLFINRGLKMDEVTKATLLFSELDQHHRLTSSIIKDLKACRRDPMDVILTMVGVEGMNDQQRQKMADHLARLPLPSLD